MQQHINRDSVFAGGVIMLIFTAVLAIVVANFEPLTTLAATFVAYGLTLVPLLLTASVVLIIIGSALPKQEPGDRSSKI